jgi:hypothetical protein
MVYMGKWEVCMSITLTLEGKVMGRKRPLFTDWRMDLPPLWERSGGRLRLRDLITSVVVEEVEAFRKLQAERVPAVDQIPRRESTPAGLRKQPRRPLENLSTMGNISLRCPRSYVIGKIKFPLPIVNHVFARALLLFARSNPLGGMEVALPLKKQERRLATTLREVNNLPTLRVRKRIVSFTMSLRGWFPRSNLLGREGS